MEVGVRGISSYVGVLSLPCARIRHMILMSEQGRWYSTLFTAVELVAFERQM